MMTWASSYGSRYQARPTNQRSYSNNYEPYPPHAGQGGYGGQGPQSGHGVQGGYDNQSLTEHHMGMMRNAYRISALLHEESSRFQTISIVQNSFYGRMLILDDLMMFTERDEFVSREMMIHVPLLAQPEPRDVLIIGGGDCGCAREVLKHESVERVVVCDIDERVTHVSRNWFPWVNPTLNDPRVELVFDDGVRYLDRYRDRFDLIVVDSTDPIGPNAVLFSEEFYRRACRSLTEHGALTTQLDSPYWDTGLAGPIYNRLYEVFPNSDAYLGTVPTYAGGSWCWAHASKHQNPRAYFDQRRAQEVGRSCRYYQAGLQSASFELPVFVQQILNGEDPFSNSNSHYDYNELALC
jgi:spermidine synthase